MGLLIWATVGISLWHFAIWLPDRFMGGLLGSLIAAIVGAVLVGFVVMEIRGLDISDRDVLTVIVAIPGAAIGLAAAWFVGRSRGVEPI